MRNYVRSFGSIFFGTYFLLQAALVAAATFIATPSPSITGSYTIQWSGATSGIAVVSEVVNGVNNALSTGKSSGSISVSGKAPGRYTYILEQKTPGAGSGQGAPTQTLYVDVVLPATATPVINPNGGSFTAPQSVNLSTSTSGATIRYTTNGSAVTSNSSIYSSPFTVSSSATVKAKAFRSGYSDSAEASAAFAINIPRVVTPVISPNGGSFTAPQTVNLSTTTSGATIRYTTNGSAVTSSSPIYTAAFTISSSATVKAKAFRSGYNDSVEASASFTINIPKVATPVISPVGGTYSEVKTVTISTATSGATIRYTTNGSTVTSSSPAYSSAITLNSSTTIKAKAFKTGYIDSAEATTNYTINIPTTFTVSPSPSATGEYTIQWSGAVFGIPVISEVVDGSSNPLSTGNSSGSVSVTGKASGRYTYILEQKTPGAGTGYGAPTKTLYVDVVLPAAATPVINPNGGSFTAPQSVNLSTSTSGATIRYTTNGSAVTSNSSIYSSPFTVSSSATVKAKAFRSGYSDSAEASAAFAINIPRVAIPVISPEEGTYTSAQVVNISTATVGAVIRFTTDGTAVSENSPEYVSPITIYKNHIIKTKAYKNGFQDSQEQTGNFSIVIPGTFSFYVNPASPSTTGNFDIKWENANSGMVQVSEIVEGVKILLVSANAGATGSFSVFSKTNGRYEYLLEQLTPGVGSGQGALPERLFVDVSIPQELPKVQDPIVTPDGGNFYGTQQVTISTPTSGSTIRYTIDGTPVTENSAIYSQPLVLTATATLKVRSFKAGHTSSNTITKTFTKSLQFNCHIEPALSTDGKFTIKWSNAEGQIELFKKDEIPALLHTSQSSGQYEVSTTFADRYEYTLTETLPGLEKRIRSCGAVDVVIPPETPVIEPRGGVYFEPVTVKINATQHNASTYFTLDGADVEIPSDPLSSSQEYVAEFPLSTSLTVKSKTFLEVSSHVSGSGQDEVTFTFLKPIKATPTQSRNGEFALSWTALPTSGATLYLYEKHNDGEWSEPIDVTADNNSIHFTGKSAGAWTYRLDRFNSCALAVASECPRLSSESVVVNVTTDQIGDLPFLIQAENYSSMSGANVTDALDVGGGLCLSISQEGVATYANHKIRVPSTGNYKVIYRVANTNTPSNFELTDISTGKVYDVVNVPISSSELQWENIERIIPLEEGVYSFDLKFSQGDMKINWLKIEGLDQAVLKAPTISPFGGLHSGPVLVTLINATPGAQIRYTIDNSVVTEDSPLYQEPFELFDSGAVKIRAKAFDNAGQASSEVQASFNFSNNPINPQRSNILVSGDVNSPVDFSPPSEIVGSMAGQFRVNETGAATYSIPIGLAQGIAGVQPEFTINYSSHAENGLLGKGWSLSGASAITRCRQTLVQDGAALPITWSEKDRYCLDGQRLILSSGIYGAPGSVYRTEIDSYIRVTAVDGVLGHPAFFRVEAKDGSISTFGQTLDAKAVGSSELPISTILTWSINRFEDSVGNAIDYKYEGDNTSGHRLSTVKYAYVDGVAKSSVNFYYVDRPDVMDGYIAGYRFKQTKRLNRITTINNGGELRTYKLEYLAPMIVKTRYHNNVSHLDYIIECRGTVCFPATTFQWGGGSHIAFNHGVSTSFITVADARRVLNNHFVDVNGDGKLDSVSLTLESYAPTQIKPYQANVAVNIKYAGNDVLSRIDLTVDSINAVKISAVDYNADGRKDLAIYKNSSWLIYISTPREDGSWKVDEQSLKISDPELAAHDVIFVDINSDGLADAVTGSGYKLLARNQVEQNTSNIAYSFSSEEHELVWDMTDMDEIAEPLPSYIPSVGHNCVELGIDKNILPESIADFNGDGVSDFVGLISRHIRCSLPGVNDVNNVRLEYQYALLNENDNLKNFSNTALSLPKELNEVETKVYNVDLNGDDLTDIVTSFKEEFSFRISTGTGLLDSQDWINIPKYQNGNTTIYAKPQLVDFNGDGGSDIVWNDLDSNQLKIHLWGEEDPSANNILRSTSGEKEDVHYLMDVTGDGILDYIKIDKSGITSHQGVMAVSTGPIPVDGNYDEPVPENRQNNAVVAISNGLGHITKINYGTLANSGRYSTTDVNAQTSQVTFQTACSELQCPPSITYSVTSADEFYNRLNGGWDLPEGSSTLVAGNQYKSAPVIEVHGSMSVVTLVETTAPAAGSLPGSIDWAATHKVDYYYGEAKMQASGRGFLGFNKLKTVDLETGVTTVTTYRQDFPFIGRPLRTVVYQENSESSKILSRAFSTWTYKTSDTSSKSYEIFLHAAQEESYDLLTAQLLQTTSTVTDFADDSTGNVDSVVVTTSGGGQEAKQIVENEYHPSEWERRMGRLASTVVRTTVNGIEDASKAVSFLYYDNGLLHQETVEEDTAEELKTTYQYDGKGNVTEVAVSNTTSQQTRTTRNVYDTNGRYLVSEYNDMGHQTSIITRDSIYGSPTTIKDLNGNYSGTFYNTMGQEYLRTDSTGGWIRTESKYCGNGQACPSGAKYFVAQTMAGGGGTTEYYDSMGRIIRKTKIGFDGTNVNVDTEYDVSGRVKRQSIPYFDGNSPLGWTVFEYDILGRVIETSFPDDSVTSVEYLGLTSTLTNAEDQTKTETRNGLGQLVEVGDNLGGKVNYTYNNKGDLLTATTTADDVSSEVKICYDRLGRKVAMLDPDKGGFIATMHECPGAGEAPSGWWTYKYNAFGELTDQRDPKGQATHMEYDLLGRMISRTDRLANGTIEAHTRWYYDKYPEGDFSDATQGNLTTVVMSTDGSENCGASNHCKTYAYDEHGRETDILLMLPDDDTGYISSINYDSIGRPFEKYDVLNAHIIGTSGVQIQYNAYGYAYRTVDIAPIDGTSGLLSEIKAVTELGTIKEQYRGNGLTTVNTYDEYTGYLKSQFTASALGINAVQDNHYLWDSVGNLKSRHIKGLGVNSGIRDNAESFCYDGLNRLVKTVTGVATADPVCDGDMDLEYDGFGNITSKVNVGAYSYGLNAGPHAVTATSSDGIYTYDHNGNQVGGAGRTLQYTSYDMVKVITKVSSGDSTKFKYGPDRNRWQRVDTKNDVVTTTTYLGNIEKIESGASVEWRRTVAGVVFSYTTDVETELFKSQTSYIYSDHLGSADLITDAAGAVTNTMSFDSWGARRSGEIWSENFNAVDLSISGFIQPVTQRGFTSHEMLDDMGIIHMNGRIYDARLGRFLQADPFIQAATDTQSYNRYSYVMNNPLNATDPTGYISLRKFVGVFVAAVMCYAAGCAGSTEALIWASAVGGAAQAAADGGNRFEIMMGFMSGAMGASAGISAGGGWSGFFSNSFFGGAMSLVGGGKFGHGFATAGVTYGLGYGAGRAGLIGDSYSRVGLVSSAVIGGTVSRITGGKFANGAVSAAFSYAVHWGASRAHPPLADGASAKVGQCASMNKCKYEDFTDEERASIQKRLDEAAAPLMNKPNASHEEASLLLHNSDVKKIADELGIEIWARISRDNHSIYMVSTGFDHEYAWGAVVPGHETKLTSGYYAPIDKGRIRYRDSVWHTHPSGGLAHVGDLNSILKMGGSAIFASGSRLSKFNNPNFVSPGGIYLKSGVTYTGHYFDSGKWVPYTQKAL